MVRGRASLGDGPIVIVGLGLIGGSLAHDLTALGQRVIGVDRPEILRAARRRRLIAAGRTTVEAAVDEGALVVLCAPPKANERLAARLLRRLPADVVVTDTGSVKAGITARARRLGARCFVAGHPMAGSEGSGLTAARAGLFRDRPWLLASDSGAEPRALGRVRALARALGARPTLIDARTHDRVMAFLSHLPQVVAWALSDAARHDPDARRALGLAGPGFRDMTRLAKSPPGLWRQILSANAPEVRHAAQAFERALRHRLRSAG